MKNLDKILKKRTHDLLFIHWVGTITQQYQYGIAEVVRTEVQLQHTLLRNGK